MGLDQPLVAEQGDAGNRMHALGMQEVSKLRYVADVDVLPAGQGVIERDVHAAIAVLDIEHDSVPANLAPVLNDPYPVVTSRHHAGQVDRADLEILGNRDCLLDDRG